MRSDKITQAEFSQDRCGLTWIQTREREGDAELDYPFWLLIDPRSDRVLATIDGPTVKQITYMVVLDNNTTRRFISLEGAKRWAIGSALSILQGEKRDSAERRKLRRAHRSR